MPENATFKLHVSYANGKTITFPCSGSFEDPDALAKALIERMEDARIDKPE